MSCIRPHIRRKRNWRHGGVPESARIFEVSKKLKILGADFTIERAVEVLTIHGRNCRSELREVKKILGESEWQVLVIGVSARRMMRRRSARSSIQARLVNEALEASIGTRDIHTPREVTATEIYAAEPGEVRIT